jgi:arylsulfatase/uncharacterized sulfatase
MNIKNLYRKLLWIPVMQCAICIPAFAAPPNIVVLVADDWGFGDIGALGSEISTPNIDSLARRGVTFSNFHVAATCSPTRAMLLTGADHHRVGVGNMPETMPAQHEGKPGYEGVLSDQAVTLATRLKDQGYHTYITGKWHLGKTPDKLPGRRGFERSFIQADSGSDNWEDRTYMMLYDKAYWFEDGKQAKPPKDFYSSELFVDKAIGYLKAQGDSKPFFAYIGFQANHIPLQAPKEFVDAYQGKYDAGWHALRQARRDSAVRLGLFPAQAGVATMSIGQDWNQLDAAERRLQSRRMEVYAGMAQAADFQIGRLMGHLKSTGQFDNTVFVFLSDNGPDPADPLAISASKHWVRSNYRTDGPDLGAKGTFAATGPRWASAMASPWSGFKYFAAEGGLRVPLIISGATGALADKRSNAFTTVKDIMPTLLDLAGLAPHGNTYLGAPAVTMDGRSMVPLLTGRADAIYRPDEPVGYELAGSAALYKGNYKLVRNIAPLGDGNWRLYDMAKDPGETQDLQQALPALFAVMQADYAEYAKNNNVLPIPEGFDLHQAGLRYAVRHFFLPKLPAVLAGLALLVGAVWWLRRRRAQARSA